MKVSAIVLTHNRPALLKRAIESVLEQTYEDMECIVVDDASNVSSEELCEGMGVRYIYIPPEESKGGNYARNVGIKASSGEYVAFLDDDDCWLPTKIEKQVGLILSKECDLVFTRRFNEFILEDGTVELVEEEYPPEDCQGNLSKRILYEIPATTSCILISRSFLIEKMGLFDENLRFWQEYELLIRVAQKTPVYMVDEPLVIYRIDKKDEKRLTNKYNEWRLAVKYVYRKHKTLYKRLSLFEKIRVRLLYHNDARVRARNSGLKWSCFINTVKCRILRQLIKLK